MTIRRLCFLAVLTGLPFFATPSHAVISFGAPRPLNSTAATDSAILDADDVDREASLATDGAGTWVAIWSSDNPLGGTIGGDFDLLYSRSTDNGATWSAAAALYASAASDGSAADTEPAIAYDGGNWVVVFSSTNTLGDTVGIDNDILVSTSSDAVNWSAPALLNSGGSSDDTLEVDGQASIAANGSGTWIVVWKHSTLGGVNPTADHVRFATSTTAGASWSAEQSLGTAQMTNIGLGQGSDVIWVGPNFLAAWGSTENLGANGNDGDILYSTITTGGVASSPALLNSNGASDTGTDLYPALAHVGGSIVAAWESNSNHMGAGLDYDILFSTSADGPLSWSAAGLLNDNAASDTGDDKEPIAVTDGSDTVFVVWGSSDDLAKTIKTDGDIVFVRSDDEGATWSSPAALGSNAVKDKGADLEPAMAFGAQDNTWIAAWESEDTLGKTIGGDEDVLFVRSAEDCPSSPVAASGCFQPTVAGKSSLTIKEGGSKDSLGWKFAKGPAIDKAADLADPTANDDYVLCVYDENGGSPSVIAELDIPAGGNCYSKPCWTDAGTGYLYKHKFGAASGLQVEGGIAGKSKASVKAKGAFRAPALPLDQDTTVSVRLHNLGNGKCFAAEYSTSTSNDGAIFKALSD